MTRPFDIRWREDLPAWILGRLSALFMPGGLIVLAACILAWRPVLIPETLLPLLRALPAVILLAGLLLAWFFHRSRVTFAILLVGFTYAALWILTEGRVTPKNGATPIISMLAILLPVNLAALLIINERGVFTSRGVWLLSALLLEALAVMIAAHSGSSAIGKGLSRTVIDTRFTEWTGLSQAALVAFGAAIVFVLIRFILNGHSVESGFIWTLVAGFLALHSYYRPDSLLYFAAAGLTLCVSLIQTSYAMAYHDDLTGLAGRRAFNETLLRLGPHYVIAMIDVDHFKSFNDNYGHDVGDQVLRMVGSKIGQLSGGGQAFRYGGEEFAMVFSNKGLTDAAPHLDALRRVIEDTRFALRARTRPRKKPTASKGSSRRRREVSVTVSIGAAEPSERRCDPAHVVKAADRALYRAKKAGRNQLKY